MRKFKINKFYVYEDGILSEQFEAIELTEDGEELIDVADYYINAKQAIIDYIEGE
jgi:hypothetical protein